MKKLIITVDGPAASGKGTISKHIKKKFNFYHLDSGLLYRIVTKEIVTKINTPVQGGLDPKILLTDKETLKKETIKYLEIFKDYPYIFNLGHGVLPETNPDMVEYLVKTVKDYK